MNSILLANRPKDLDEEQFKTTWENSGYLLSALYKTINDLAPPEAVKGDDFNIQNHYAKLMWQAGQLDFMRKILALFPESCK